MHFIQHLSGFELEVGNLAENEFDLIRFGRILIRFDGDSRAW